MTLRYLSLCLLFLGTPSQAFSPPVIFDHAKPQQRRFHPNRPPPRGTTTALSASSASPTPVKKTLGLLTFDLDDSLYPIEVVMDEANAAFARAMNEFGFSGIQPSNIAETCQEIRRELPPEESIILTHTEVRRLAIRREMEQVIYQRKLQETADDWATALSDLSPIVKNFAKK